MSAMGKGIMTLILGGSLIATYQLGAKHEAQRHEEKNHEVIQLTTEDGKTIEFLVNKANGEHVPIYDKGGTHVGDAQYNMQVIRRQGPKQLKQAYKTMSKYHQEDVLLENGQL